MHRIKTNLAFPAILLTTALPMLAMSVEEVIEKHIEAKGGRDNWAKIETIKLSDSLTGFSKVASFTQYRARDNRYLMDYMLNERAILIGYDGETAWWENGFRIEGSSFIQGAELAKQTRSLIGHFWVFFGALSNVEYTVTVIDKVTGNQKVYFDPMGTFASFGETDAFPAESD